MKKQVDPSSYTISWDTTVLIAKPFENTLGCVTLLPGTTDIIAKPLIDDVCEPVQLWPLDRRRSAVAGRYRVDDHFINAVTGDPKRPGYRPLAQALLEIRPTHLQIQFHGENTPTLPVARKGQSGRLLRRPQRGYPAATVADFSVVSHEMV